MRLGGICVNGSDWAVASQEERSPIYEETLNANNDHTTFPSKFAGPDEIRDFLMHLLIFKSRLSEEHAQKVAARWSTGSGGELRSLSLAGYLDTFGWTDGRIVYKEVSLEILDSPGARKGLRMSLALPIYSHLEFQGDWLTSSQSR